MVTAVVTCLPLMVLLPVLLSVRVQVPFTVTVERGDYMRRIFAVSRNIASGNGGEDYTGRSEKKYTLPSFAGHVRGDSCGKGDFDKSGLGIACGEIADSGDGAGGTDGYGDEYYTSEEF